MDDQRLIKLHQALADQYAARDLCNAALMNIESAWVESLMPPMSERQRWDGFQIALDGCLATIRKIEREIAIIQWEQYEQRKARSESLLTRRCQLRCEDGWECQRSIGNLDEAETYCRVHRSTRNRASIRRRHRIVDTIQTPKIIARKEVPPQIPIEVVRPAQWKSSVSDGQLQILTDRIVELDALPPEHGMPILASHVERAASSLMSWGYSVLNRRHSRRYEGFRRPEFSY